MLKIDDIPDLPADRHPERITTAISCEAYLYLEKLRNEKRKGPADLIRMLLDAFINENPL